MPLKSAGSGGDCRQAARGSRDQEVVEAVDDGLFIHQRVDEQAKRITERVALLRVTRNGAAPPNLFLLPGPDSATSGRTQANERRPRLNRPGQTCDPVGQRRVSVEGQPRIGSPEVAILPFDMDQAHRDVEHGKPIIPLWLDILEEQLERQVEQFDRRQARATRSGTRKGRRSPRTVETGKP